MDYYSGIGDMFKELQDLQAKYSDYTPINSSAIPYHDPETPEQAARAKQVKNGSTMWFLLFSVAFIVTLILAIVSHAETWAIVLLSVICLGIVACTIKVMVGRPMVVTGTVIYKHLDGTPNQPGTYQFYVSVIPDGAGKVIARNIKISRQDFDQVVEGTRVMVVKGGNGFACLL